MPPPKREGAEVGKYLPPARLELSKSPQVHLDPPGWVQVPPAAWPGGGVSVCSPLPPSGAAPPPPRGGETWARAGPVSRPWARSRP